MAIRVRSKDHELNTARLIDVTSVNPFRCRLWKHHDRLGEYLTVESCKQEIASFQKHGQLVPAIGRRLVGDPDYDIELICGARRLFITQHLNLGLLVEIRSNLSDRDGVVAMDIENRHRADISPYERGRSYAAWLRSGLFASQKDIAAALGISASQVSRLLSLGSLPAVILNAFDNPHEIREQWGLKLHEMWNCLSSKGYLAREARCLAEKKPNLSAHLVYQRLVSSIHGDNRVQSRLRDRVVLGPNGKPLFRIKYQLRHVNVVVPLDTITSEDLEKMCEWLSQVCAQRSV